MVTDKPVAFSDLKPDQFPFVIQVLDDETIESLWQQTVRGPGVLEIPGFAPRAVRTRIWHPDGTVVESRPNGETALYDMSEELAELKTLLAKDDG